MYITLSFAAGYLIDLCFGDPRKLIHPVQLIGSLIQETEKLIRNIFPKTQRGEYWGGVFLAVIVMLLSTAVPSLILYIAWKINAILYYILQALMFYQLLAVKSLKKESMKVYKELIAQDIDKAREAVSMIVGRDTQNLTFRQVTKAAVETIAESASDGIVAPMFFMILGGVPFVYLYKAVNTMDSMIGYKNDKYLYFGRFAAKLDDVFNYIPSRLAAFFMIAAAYLLKYDGRNAVKIFKRDRYNHTSPNSAQTESVCAGALDIQLAGNAYYFGKLYEKPTIGDPIREIEITDIVKTNRLMYMTAFVSAAVFTLIRTAIIILIK